MAPKVLPYILTMEAITKRFGAVVANDGISFAVRQGSIHALLGENGAGKTTLMNVLYGLYQPDAGRIVLRDQPVRLASPRDAIRHGIGMIHQQFMLVPPLTVAENIILGLGPRRGPFLDLAAVESEISKLSRAYRLEVDPRAAVWQLPVGAQQRVEILKALYRRADLFVLDEPTSVLTPTEIDALFEVLRRLASEGKSIIFISHKLEEVMRISDQVTVLRQGRVVGTVPTHETAPPALARMMVGRDVVLRVDKTPAQPGPIVHEVRGLNALNDRALPALRGISYTIRAGEILGIAGVDGNGQTELTEAIAGLRHSTRGQILVGNRDVTNLPPHRRGNQRLGYIPADRQRFGIILDFSVANNLVLREFDVPPFARNTFLNRRAIADHARTLGARYDIRMTSVDQVVRQLSGGNQQKVVLARESSGNPELILALQPTRGLDVGAAEFVLRTLLAQRDRGAAILYISTELDELLTMSDRLAVIFDGELMGIVQPEEASLEEIGLMMAGALRKIPATAEEPVTPSRAHR